MVQQERDSAHYRLGPTTLRLGNVYRQDHHRDGIQDWVDAGLPTEWLHR